MDLNTLLARLDKVKQSGDEHTARCPAHADSQNSLSVAKGADGRLLLKCFAGCDVQSICTSLGIEVKELFASNGGAAAQARALTLIELARDKGIPSDFLREIGCVEYPGGIKVQYWTAQKVLASRQRLRTALKAKDGSTWTKGSGSPIAYGVWREPTTAELIIVEGESDCWTLWYHGRSAIGLPGASMASKIQGEHIKGYSSIYVWQETDRGGAEFVAGVTKQLAKCEFAGEVYVISGAEVGAKDVNEMHKRALKNKDSFLALLNAAMQAAVLVDLSAPTPSTGAGASAPTSAAASDGFTDMGNSERLVREHGEDIRYCYLWKKWLVWDGKRWRSDEGGALDRLAEQVVRGIYAEATQEQDGDKRKKIVAWAKKSEERGKIKAMIDGAKSKVAISPDQLDVSPWLLNVDNGTIDLKTGTLIPHERHHFITKITPVRYDKGAQSPIWRAFLERCMESNTEMQFFLRRAVGYTLTGVTTEECLFFLYGDGRNGKSKFLEAVEYIMGDYAKTTRAETFMEQRFGGGIPNDIAALTGVRYVPTSETSDGKHFAEGLIKQVTGGDTVQARFLHSEFFSYKPQFKIWFASNHKPVIKGLDTAIWERINIIPFTAYIPPAERDKELGRKLEREASGILSWAVEGCLEWQRIGLQTPESVQQATEAYKQEMDKLRDFVTDECILGPRMRVSNVRLWESYEKWCEENGEKHPLSRRLFKIQLEQYGVAQGRDKERYWSGIGLLADGPQLSVSWSAPPPSPTPMATLNKSPAVTPKNKEGKDDVAATAAVRMTGEM